MIATDTKALVTYDVSEAILADTKQKCASLTADTPKGYEEVRVAIGHLRDTRVKIEARRVELKADALAFGRLVDSEAKRLTALVLEIEDPLKAKKDAVDQEKARAKAEAEAAKLRALEAEIAANRARQEAELKAAREAEEARLAAERAALAEERRRLDEARQQAEAQAAEERARAEAERVRLAEERRAEEERQRAARRAEEDRLRAEREAIEAERRKVAAERERAERAEFERQAKIRAEAEAKAHAERERIAAAERQARLDQLKPDIEKVRAFAATIRSCAAPKPRSKAAQQIVAAAYESLAGIATTLETWEPT